MASPSSASLWTIGPIPTPRLTWGELRRDSVHKCPWCGIILLTGEDPGFCCGPRGSRLQDIPPLSPLPPSFQTLIDHPDISSLSRILNLVFSFASLETTHTFPSFNSIPGFLAIQGRVYHHVQPSHKNSAVHWLLHDGFRQHILHAEWASTLPDGWIDIVHSALLQVNLFAAAVGHLSTISDFECPDAQLIIHDSGASQIAAVLSFDNTSQSNLFPRCLVISKTDDCNHAIPTVSRLWEPLAYPLLFPHGSLGWGLVGKSSDVTAGSSRMLQVTSLR
jgi:hypothetical protein